MFILCPNMPHCKLQVGCFLTRQIYKFQPHTDLCIVMQNTEEEINELIAELDPDENGFLDWIQWVTQLISVSRLFIAACG